MSADAPGGTDPAAAAASARRELDRLLAAQAARPGLDLPSDFGDRVEHYVRLLLEANERINLTRITLPAAVARDHLLDALSALAVIDEAPPRRAVDIGAGGGVPGIVLALARPDVAWTLADSVRKKVDVLRSFVEALELPNVTALAARAEDLGRDGALRESFDLATARACASLPVLAEYALPLVRTGATVIAWKGSMTDAELEGGRRAAGLLGGRIELRETGFGALGTRRFVVMRKRRGTPEGYPRRAGEPAKRPLG